MKSQVKQQPKRTIKRKESYVSFNPPIKKHENRPSFYDQIQVQEADVEDQCLNWN